MIDIFKKVLIKFKKEVNKRFTVADIKDVGYKTKNISVRIAVVGLGKQGGKLCRYLINMGYNVVVVCDLSKKRINMLKKDFPSLYTTTNIKDLESYNIDICVLATLANGRFSIIKKLNEIGINKILSEKPISNKISECKLLFNYINDNNMRIEVYNPFLFSEDIKIFKQKLEKLNKGSFLNAKLFFKPSGLANIGSHIFASFQYLTNVQIDRVVKCKLFDNNRVVRTKKSRDPNAKVIYKTTDDSNVFLDCSTNYCSKTKFFIEYENLFISLYNNDKLLVSYKNKENDDLMFISKNSINKFSGRYRALDHAITKLNTKKSHSLNYALNAVELIIASHLSFHHNKSISLPLKEDVETIYNFS